MPRQRKGSKAKDDGPIEAPRESVEIREDVNEKGGASSSSDEEAGDDPVVKTFDVFVSHKLKDYIYLLQYPIRNPDEQYHDDSAPYQARIKPTDGSLEIDVPIDTTNYNVDQGQKFAGAQTNSNGKREKKVLDRQRLSGKAQLNQASYFVGVMRGGLTFRSLVLTFQIKCISHLLEPQFSYGLISTIMMRPWEINEKKAKWRMVLQSNLEQCRCDPPPNRPNDLAANEKFRRSSRP